MLHVPVIHTKCAQIHTQQRLIPSPKAIITDFLSFCHSIQTTCVLVWVWCSASGKCSINFSVMEFSFQPILLFLSFSSVIAYFLNPNPSSTKHLNKITTPILIPVFYNIQDLSKLFHLKQIISYARKWTWVRSFRSSCTDFLIRASRTSIWVPCIFWFRAWAICNIKQHQKIH